MVCHNRTKAGKASSRWLAVQYASLEAAACAPSRPDRRDHWAMPAALYLRKVIHPQARDNYRVLLKDDGLAIEVGSIGIQQGSASAEHWTWAIDTVVAMGDIGAQGRGKDREDCMRQFRAAWERFCSDPARLTGFLQKKRKRL